MQTQPYLVFEGRCEEALQFYHRTIGAEVTMLLRFKDAPKGEQGGPPAALSEKVMHSNVRIGDTTILASDGRCSGHPNFQGFSLALITANDAEAKRTFAALSEGGQVQQPLTKTFFSSLFGILTDRFGVSWMVLVRE